MDGLPQSGCEEERGTVSDGIEAGLIPIRPWSSFSHRAIAAISLSQSINSSTQEPGHDQTPGPVVTRLSCTSTSYSTVASKLLGCPVWHLIWYLESLTMSHGPWLMDHVHDSYFVVWAMPIHCKSPKYHQFSSNFYWTDKQNWQTKCEGAISLHFYCLLDCTVSYICRIRYY